jgi:hypothetical protein
MKNNKPLNRKSYGSIAHLPTSRFGAGDHKCSDGQARIATEKKRDKHDLIIVQEKVDGSNVGVAKLNGEILPITRAGYLANTSPYEMHHKFHEWVLSQKARFNELLNEGERICAEWMLVAHGTKYILPHEPFIAFDIMVGAERITFDELTERIKPFEIIQPKLISRGEPLSIVDALKAVEVSGHGAIDSVEGCVWRVERNALNKHTGERKWTVDFLVKYVKQDKIDGLYLSDDSPVYNEILT